MTSEWSQRWIRMTSEINQNDVKYKSQNDLEKFLTLIKKWHHSDIRTAPKWHQKKVNSSGFCWCDDAGELRTLFASFWPKTIFFDGIRLINVGSQCEEFSAIDGGHVSFGSLKKTMSSRLLTNWRTGNRSLFWRSLIHLEKYKESRKLLIMKQLTETAQLSGVIL